MCMKNTNYAVINDDATLLLSSLLLSSPLLFIAAVI